VSPCRRRLSVRRIWYGRREESVVQVFMAQGLRLVLGAHGEARVTAADSSRTERRERVLELIDREFGRATSRFPAFNSGHEGKAVIEEELDELWEEIRSNRPSGAAATREAIQVAAMAMRYVFDLSDWDFDV
jgi:hypothetical protein